MTSWTRILLEDGQEWTVTILLPFRFHRPFLEHKKLPTNIKSYLRGLHDENRWVGLGLREEVDKQKFVTLLLLLRNGLLPLKGGQTQEDGHTDRSWNVLWKPTQKSTIRPSCHFPLPVSKVRSKICILLESKLLYLLETSPSVSIHSGISTCFRTTKD